MARPKTISDNAIIEAVRQALAERGASFTAAEVARSLGVSQAALMKRVGGRAALVAFAVGAGPQRPSLDFLGTIPRVDEDRPLASHLERLLRLLLDVARVEVPELAWMRAFKIPLDDVYLLPEGPAYLTKRKVAGWFRRLQKAGHLEGLEAEAWADIVVGLAEARAFREHFLGEPSTPEATQDWCRQARRLLYG